MIVIYKCYQIPFGYLVLLTILLIRYKWMQENSLGHRALPNSPRKIVPCTAKFPLALNDQKQPQKDGMPVVFLRIILNALEVLNPKIFHRQMQFVRVHLSAYLLNARRAPVHEPKRHLKP